MNMHQDSREYFKVELMDIGIKIQNSKDKFMDYIMVSLY